MLGKLDVVWKVAILKAACWSFKIRRLWHLEENFGTRDMDKYKLLPLLNKYHGISHLLIATLSFWHFPFPRIWRFICPSIYFSGMNYLLATIGYSPGVTGVPLRPCLHGAPALTGAEGHCRGKNARMMF